MFSGCYNAFHVVLFFFVSCGNCFFFRFFFSLVSLFLRVACVGACVGVSLRVSARFAFSVVSLHFFSVSLFSLRASHRCVKVLPETD